MSGDELGPERARRIGCELLDFAVGARSGDLDRTLERVGRDDALEVLGAVVRELALLCATTQLRDPADDEPTAGGGEEAPASAAAPDGIVDPWEATDPATETLEAGRLLWEALSGQESVGGLLRGLETIEDSEARAVVLERALAKMAEERRPGRREPEG